MSSSVALVHIVLLFLKKREKREREGEKEIERYAADIHTYIHDI